METLTRGNSMLSDFGSLEVLILLLSARQGFWAAVRKVSTLFKVWAEGEARQEGGALRA